MRRAITIEPIQNGTVLDHIQTGKAIFILNILKIPQNTTMGIAVNVPSKRCGQKDIIFVEGLEISEKDIAKIALISPQTTLNIIRGGVVIKKIQLNAPDKIDGILHCPNPMCITNHEQVQSSFFKSADNKLTCRYCEMEFDISELLQTLYKKEKE